MPLSKAPSAVFLNCEFRAGIWSGLTPPVEYSDFMNFERLELSVPGVETEKLVSRMTSSLGAALDSQPVPTDEVARVEAEFSTMPPSLIAIALGATVVETARSGVPSVTAEPITTVQDVWVPLATNGAIDGSSVALTIGALVDPSEYEVDAELAMIKALTPGASGTGTIDYAVPDRTWEDYTAGIAVDEFVHITGQATDKVTGYIGIMDIWRANLAPNGTFDPVGGGHLRGSVAGDLIVPTVNIRGELPTTPWRWRRRSS